MLVKIRGDGNCCFTSSTPEALLWATCQPDSTERSEAWPKNSSLLRESPSNKEFPNNNNNNNKKHNNIEQ